jgi:hypothetical protein
MEKPYIKYRSGYKYQLTQNYEIIVSIRPEKDIPTNDAIKKFLELRKDGTLLIKIGYAWDGPSGPTFDIPCFMRGSLVHDALYQLLRSKDIGQEWRDEADYELKRICREDGMWKILGSEKIW